MLSAPCEIPIGDKETKSQNLLGHRTPRMSRGTHNLGIPPILFEGAGSYRSRPLESDQSRHVSNFRSTL